MMEKKEKNIIFHRLCQNLIGRMKRDKRFEIAVYGVLILLGVILYVWSASAGESKTAAGQRKEAGMESAVSAASDTELRLKTALSAIRGVGRVEVMLTYRGEEAGGIGEKANPFGGLESTSKGSTQLKSGAVCGVIVIAEGARDIAVRMDLHNAVKTVLGVDASCIEIFEMKAEEGETE